MLGKRGLSYRHMENEVAYTLNDYVYLALVLLRNRSWYNYSRACKDR